MRALVWLCLLPVTARAQDLSARLSVEQSAAAAQCPGRAELAQRVESILHRGPEREAGGSESQLAIDIHFERAADGAFVARVSASGPKPGQRVLRDASPSCDALGEAVSVAIALLVDSAVSSRDVADARPTVTEVPQRKRPDTEAAARGAPSANMRTWRARAAIEGGAGYGLGGAGAALGFGRLGARVGRVVLDVGGGGSAPSSTAYAGGSVHTSLLFGSARICYQLGRTLTIAPCALFGLGRLRGAGTGYGERDQVSSLPWTAAGLGLAAEARLSRCLFASFGATLWVPTRRQTFSVEHAGIAWESKPLAGALSAGLGVELF